MCAKTWFAKAERPPRVREALKTKGAGYADASIFSATKRWIVSATAPA